MWHKWDSWMVARFPLQQPFSSMEVEVVRRYSKLFFFALSWQHFFLTIIFPVIHLESMMIKPYTRTMISFLNSSIKVNSTFPFQKNMCIPQTMLKILKKVIFQPHPPTCQIYQCQEIECALSCIGLQQAL